MANSNQIDLPRVRAETFVRQIEFLDEVSSTNDWTIQKLGEPIQADDPEAAGRTPLLVITPKQTVGRGRGLNRWWSGEGGLTFSLAIDIQQLDSDLISKTSLTVGLAICQSLERFAPSADFGLKWPNDVYLEGRKICGILIERPSTSPETLVIGVGINVNNSIRQAPEELQSTAVALIDCLDVEQDLTTTLIECLHQIERRLEALWNGDKTLLDQWQAYDMLLGKTVVVDTYSQDVQGVCQGIDSSGALTIKQPNGQIHRCVGGIVRQISFD